MEVIDKKTTKLKFRGFYFQTYSYIMIRPVLYLLA